MNALTIPGLPFPLEPEGSPPCVGDHRDGVLTLTGDAGTDMFIDPNGSAPDPLPDAGRFVGVPPPGDFTLSARVTADFKNVFDAGVLLVHATDRVWAKLCFEFSPQRRPTAVTVVTRGTSDDSNSFEVDGTALWLRITRIGQAWAFHASTDGTWWRLLRYFSLGEGGSGENVENVKVGFLAQSPTGDGSTMAFDELAFRANAPADLRDGS